MNRFLLLTALALVFLNSACSSRSKELKNAETYIQVNELAKAKELIDLELQTNPKNPDAYVMLARVFLLMGDPPDARAAFDKALLLDAGKKSGIADVYFEAAQSIALRSSDGGLPLVVTYVQEASTLDPDMNGKIVDWALNRAKAQSVASKTVVPITLLQAIAKAVPDSKDRIAGALMDISKAYEDKQFLHEAAAYAMESGQQSAAKIADASVAMRNACTLLPAEDRSYARTCLEKAMQWNPALAHDDDVYWLTKVSLTNGGASQAGDYLANFPNGKHVGDAQALKSAAEADAKEAAEKTYTTRICDGAGDGQPTSVYRDLSQQTPERFTVDLHPGCLSGYILLPQSWEYYRMEAVNPSPNWWLAYRWYQSKNSGSGENPPLKVNNLVTMRHGSHKIRVEGSGQLMFYPIP